MGIQDVLGGDFDSAQLTGQRGANLYKFQGRHKIKITQFKPLGRKPGFSLDGELVASTSGALQPGASVGFPMVKGQYPEYFQSMVKRVIGGALGQAPEKIKGNHVAAASQPTQPLKSKIITVETTAPNEKGYSQINILGGDEVPVTQAAYNPATPQADGDGGDDDGGGDGASGEPDFDFS